VSWEFPVTRASLPMKAEIKAFFKAFTYAFSGIVQGIKSERNIRFHLCAAVTVLWLMQFYELDVSEKCIIFLCIGSVIAAELLNTAVENAVDLHGSERTPRGKAAKDCAAGAVLVMSVSAAVCGIAIFLDRAVIREIANYFAARPYAVICAVLWAAASFLFIFGFDTKKK